MVSKPFSVVHCRRMKQVRCPYCVEGNDFKVMTPRDAHVTCLKCGHVVVPDRPTYTGALARNAENSEGNPSG